MKNVVIPKFPLMVSPDWHTWGGGGLWVWSKSEIKWYKCKKMFFEEKFRYFGLIFGKNRDF